MNPSPELHLALSAAVLAALWMAGWLALRLRRQAQRGLRMAQRADTLRALSEALRDADDPMQQAQPLQQALAALGTGAVLLTLRGALPMSNDESAAQLLGQPDADTLAGLWLCLRENRAFGSGTGRHEQQGHWYLPLRGRSGSVGAACVFLGQRDADALRDSPHHLHEATERRAHAQALCDQMGLALQRAAAQRDAQQSRDEAQAQRVRNTLLAAISHDYRTPLATILGAASALQQQHEKLSPEQRQRLATSIEAEALQLKRLTDNTLQLARLDTPGLALQLDWESAEEIVGAALRRFRERDRGSPREAGPRVRVRVEPGLPLLRCDAALLVQMLDNLLDNALKHGAAPGDDPAAEGRGEGRAEGRVEGSVELRACAQPGVVVLAVRDRGPGVPPALRGRIFEVFQRGEGPLCRGTGLGLALCRAIARAHGGELVYRPRGHGGACFECRLPVAVQPAAETQTAVADTANLTPTTATP